MKNRLTRMLSFLLIVATLCSLLGVFASAASEVDSSVKMLYNRKFNEGWDYTNGMGGGAGLTPFINHEYDDNYDYNYYLEVTEAETSIAGGKLSLTNSYTPTSGKTVLSFSLKLPSDSSQDYGTVVNAVTKNSGADYTLLSIKDNQITSLGTLLGTVYNDEWIDFQFVMGWDDSSRICEITVEGGGLSTSAVLPLEEGQRGSGLNYVYFGMGNRSAGSTVRTYGIDNLVFYNMSEKVIAEEDLGLYGVGSLVKETVAKTIEIYGETTLAPTDYIKKGLTMKVGVNYYMTDVLTDEVRGTYTHTKLNIYESEEGYAYGAPVKVDGVVYVPLELILQHLGYEYRARENSIEISTGGTTSVCITFGSTSASVNGQRVELAGAPGFATTEVKGKEFSYIVIPLDNVETFFAQESAKNPLYVTYDDMGLIFLCGKKNVWNRAANLGDMATLMEKFIFDYDYVNGGKGFGERLVKDIEEYTGFDHPYLFADQDRWDTLRAVWLCDDQEAYDKLMALSPAEKEELGISGADPTGYSETLRTWLRGKLSIGVYDPDYIFANGEWVSENGEANPAGTNLTQPELLYAAGNAYLILDSEGKYLGMNPGSSVVGSKLIGGSSVDGFSYRGSIVNRQLIKNGGKYDDGYDDGGRHSLNTGSIMNWGYYYQLTRDLRYAQITYDWIAILGDTDIWEHWGPTHFLNPADATTTVAIAYDLLCPAWDALVEKGIARPTAYTEVYKVYNDTASGTIACYMTAQEFAERGLTASPDETTVVVRTMNEETGEYTYTTKEVTLSATQEFRKITNVLKMTPPSFPEYTTYDRYLMAKIIADQGVHEGYLAEVYDMTDHPSVRCLGGFEWKSNTDNWNPVCTKGMALGAMMTVEYEEFRAEATAMTDIMMYYFFVNGLNEYAPDGSYYESASYWSYGTNAVFQLAAAFVSATGTDYGIMDCYGLDRTCYFAANVESSDAHIWTYNDAGGGGTGPSTSGMSTDWFMWVGNYTGDQGLIDHRIYQIENGLKTPSYYDIFTYRPEYSGVETIDLPLSYYMEGLNTYCGAYSVRSSWEKGAMCISMIGGTNAVAHADVDAGAFMYWNDGKGWIWDLGADNYNLTSFFGASYSGTTLPNRFRYYRHGAEGNNVVVLAGHEDVLPFGQRVKGVAPLQRQYSDENGAFAIWEMLDIYSADPELAGTATPLVTTAIRGVMATDGYETAVVQDEIMATKLETFYWFAHFSDATIETTITDDGRVCYMRYRTPDRDPETGDPHYSILRLTIVSPDTSDKFYITGTGDEDMVFAATFRYGTHQNYPDQVENDRSTARRLCIKRNLKTNFRVAVVFEMLPDAFYNPKTGAIDIAGGQDTYECSYKWTDMYNWKPKAAVDHDFGGGGVEDGTNEEVLSVLDLQIYSTQVLKYGDAGTAYSTDFYNMFAAISRVQRVWDKFGNSDMVKPFVSGYQNCEEYIRSYTRIQNQLNQSSEYAVKISRTLAGMR